MSFVYEITAQISEFVPGTGGFPLIVESGAIFSAFGEDRTVRVFSEDANILLGLVSGLRIYDPVLDDFVEPDSVGGIVYSGSSVVSRVLSAGVALSDSDPGMSERIAYDFRVEGEPFRDIPETEGTSDVFRVASSLGIDSVDAVRTPPFSLGQPFPLDDLVGTFLGEAGLGVSEQRAKNIALLYETGLDRDGNIDLAGLNFWIDSAEAGLSNSEIAGFFTRAPEFEANYGPIDDLTNAEYVDLLYQNTLERQGDADGVEFWNDRLESGASRADLLFAFAISVENAETLEFVDTLVEFGPGEWAFV